MSENQNPILNTTPAETKVPEYIERYANNCQGESSVWDLRLRFGTLDQSTHQSPTVRWHTAINMPWAQAKLLVYLLQMHIAFHEAQTGQIKIAANVMPPPVDAVLAALPDDAANSQLREKVAAFRAQLEG